MITAKWQNGKTSVCRRIYEKNLLGYFEEPEGRAYYIVVYDDGVPASCGALYNKNGTFEIYGVVTENEYRNKNYADLVVRMIIRKASEMGANKVYAKVPDESAEFFERIGFEKTQKDKSGNWTMLRFGDVCGSCNV